MAKLIYGNGKIKLCAGAIDCINDALYALLIDLDYYSPDTLNDLSVSDISTDAIVSEALLTGKNLTLETIDGDYCAVFRADDIIFNNITDTKKIDCVVIAVKAATYTESWLLVLWTEAANFPIAAPSNDDIVIEWPSEGIFII